MYSIEQRCKVLPHCLVPGFKYYRVDVWCMQMRSDSIQDLSFVRDADRFNSATKHLNDLRSGSTSAQADTQKEIPPAGLSGLCTLGFTKGGLHHRQLNSSVN